jgi:hypothetical protein
MRDERCAFFESACKNRARLRALLFSWLLAANLVAEPNGENRSPLPTESFVDIEGVTHDFDFEYRRFRSDDRYTPQYERAVLQDIVILAGGTLQYWLSWRSNSKDWDGPSFEDRMLLRGIRFDNNTFTTNQLLHPAAGLGYYVFPRANGVGMPMAILYTQFGSIIWEYGLEWRELVSFNDLVFTPVAGIAGGEFTFHLGDYLNTAPPGSIGAAIGQAIFGLPVTLQTWFDGRRVQEGMPRDNLGLSTAYWHRFEVAYQAVDNRDENGHHTWLHGAAAAATLVSVPGFLRPGRFDVLFADGNFSEARGRLLFDEQRLADSEVWVSACLVGYYAQDFVVRAAGLHGGAAMIGIGTAFGYLDRTIVDDQDQVGVAHFVGPNFGVWLKSNGLAFSLTGDVHGDFAAIHSLALERLRAENQDTTLRSVFDNDYQFSLGVSGRARATLSYGPLVFGSSVHYGTYTSVDGYDRREDEVTLDTQGSDAIGRYALGLALEPRGGPLSLSLNRESYWHRSRLNEFSETRRHSRLFGSLGLVF